MNLPDKYIAIDIETTGLTGDIADVVQIGAVVLNEDLTTGPTMSIVIRPTTDFRDPKAMAVHGITEEQLAAADEAEVCLDIFERWCAEHVGRRPQFAAWGAYFDVSFMKAYYKRLNRKWPFSHKAFCLKTAAIWEASTQGISGRGGLGSFVERLGLTFEGKPHDGLDDILMSVKVVQALTNQRS
jgi:DNA polymerase III epsilon subunit-like protein